jgi:hypothetical protein
MGRDARGRRIGAGEEDDETLVGDRLEVGLEAADVVRSTDDHRRGGMPRQPFSRRRDRLPHHPRSGQPPPVPHEGGAAILQRLGVALEQDLGHHAGPLLGQAGARQERRREREKFLRRVPRDGIPL